MDQEISLYSAWWAEKAAAFWQVLQQHVLVRDVAMQSAILISLFFLALFLSRHVAAWLEVKVKSWGRKSIIKLHASHRELFFLFFLAIFFWCAATMAEAAEMPFQFLRMAASLTTAWAVIRLTSSTIQNAFWARLIAMSLWVLAALNIVGWLSAAVALADHAGITVGEFRLTPLVVMKGILAFALLFWAVNVISSVLDRGFKKAHGMTPSQRVLFTKISNIVLYCLAAMMGMNIIGLDLTALTVFSGALGLGIGFGLQKVFSNLISGIILLMDKSVKPGDVIVVGNTFGWVNSLGARCVSVLTRDGKEHLIPNENLITQEVENWSYSSEKIRIHVPIGVSYNSDIHRVKALLLEAVLDHPRTLPEPPPVCFIAGFGDSSIDHEILVWIADPADGVSNFISDTYYRIWDLFKENDIEIPFPQRDVHLKYPEEAPKPKRKAAGSSS